MGRGPGQVMVHIESRADVINPGFWKQGITAMFDMQIINLDAGSYLCMTLKKALVKAEKDKKYKYLQAFLYHRNTFTTMVCSTDLIHGKEALAAQKRLALNLIFKLNWEYSEMCCFVRARMSLEIVISNNLILRGPRDKEAKNRQILYLMDGVVMELLTPW